MNDTTNINNTTNVTVRLLNLTGDEVGSLTLDAVRAVPAGTESASPDLSRQMTQLIERLDSTLAERDLVPVLDPLGMRIAVSRALLNAGREGVCIPLQIRPLGGGRSGRRNAGPDPGISAGGESGTSADSGWGDLFALDEDEGQTLPGIGRESPADPQRPDRPGGSEAMDPWTELGTMWDMGDAGDEKDGD